ncbi:MAG TPA: O-antigen ligase family protein [Candidatus Saccharimonadia bacterium]|nr:O-antigen ligase family protein [Candidatus Saccharimonadia bacterium]
MKHKSWEPSIYRVSLLILVGLLILGNLGRISLTDRVAFYLQDILLGCMSIWVVTQYRLLIELTQSSSSSISFQTQRWIRPLVFFCATIILSLLFAAMLGAANLQIGIAYAVRFFLYAILIPFLALGLHKTYISLRDIRIGLLIMSAGIGLIGLVQYLFLPDMRFLQILGYDNHYFRLISTLFDPPFTAEAILVGIFLLIGQSKKQLWQWVLLLVLFIALLLTYSRSAFVSLAIGIIVFCLQKKQAKILLILAALLIGIFLLPRPASEGARLERTQSIVSRVNVLMSGIKSLDAKTLLIGNGWYMTNASSTTPQGVSQLHSSATDNSYLHVLQSVGLLGLAAFLWFLVEVVKKYRDNATILPILATILTGSLTNNLIFYPTIMIVLWAMLSFPQKHGEISL